MRARYLIATLAALALPAAASAQTASDKIPHTPPRDPAALALMRAIEAAEQQDCPGMLAAAEPVLASPTVASLPAPLLRQAYEAAADCQLKASHPDTAYRYALAGTELPGASNWLWMIRFGLEADGKHFAAATASIEAMHRAAPQALNALQMRWLYAFNRQLRERHETELQRRLLRIVTGPDYAPVEATGTRDFFRLDYARMLLREGDTPGARALVAQISLPTTLLELDIDPATRGLLPPGLDLRAAVERDLAKSRTIMAARPDLLDPLLETAQALRQLGRPQESLALLEGVRPRVQGKGEAFGDAAEKTNWWWDSVARSEEMLGHVDRALTAFRVGTAADENGGANVSQQINLAEALDRAGKPRDALAVLAPFDGPGLSVSPYGMAEMRRARGCANALAGNPAASADDLAWLRAHTADNPDALTSLLLCMNDMDGAAAAMIARLDDPDRRVRALIDLSDFDAPPVAQRPDPIDSKLPALKARPDVQAAITRAGGTRSYHVQRTEL